MNLPIKIPFFGDMLAINPSLFSSHPVQVETDRLLTKSVLKSVVHLVLITVNGNLGLQNHQKSFIFNFKL